MIIRMWLMGFGALVSLVAQRPGLGLRIVVIRIVVISILKCSGTGFDQDFNKATIWRLYIYSFFLSFQNGACFHGVAHENTLRHNEVTWSEIFFYFSLIFPREF